MKKPASKKRSVHFLVGELLMDLANVPDWWVGQPRGAFTDTAQFERHRQWAEDMRTHYPEAFEYCTSPEIIALRELVRLVWTSRDKEWFIFLLRRFHSEIMRRVEALRKDAGENLVREWNKRKAALDIILMTPEAIVAVRQKRHLRGRRYLSLKRLKSKMTYGRALCAFLSELDVNAVFNERPPNAGYFEDCAAYLQRRLKLIRICKWPDCQVRRYFIADKPKQKYCSDICAREARLASKRESWHRHPEWEKGKKRR